MMSQVSLSKCPICDKEGAKEIIERLPNDGVFVRLVHLDGSVHDWAEYYSNDHRLVREPKRMHCPICGKMGRINSWHPNPTKPWIINYQIVHGEIQGTWGKQKLQRRERHDIKDQSHRDQILKRLGRYIEK